jgi:hypothetical protein
VSTFVGERRAINNVGYGRMLGLFNRGGCYVCLITEGWLLVLVWRGYLQGSVELLIKRRINIAD